MPYHSMVGSWVWECGENKKCALFSKGSVQGPTGPASLVKLQKLSGSHLSGSAQEGARRPTPARPRYIPHVGLGPHSVSIPTSAVKQESTQPL